MTFYMFEHGRAVNEAGRDDIPDLDEDDLDKAQRYKNYLAKEDAAYIEFTGNYVSQNQFRYRVTYRLYVGGNATDDFTIKPNCQYKNNITVTGISVNNYGDEALLDTRVTIDEDTPAFIEMLRERQFDSHFNVTPMDIYLNGEGASVTVEILNADETPWVRMEPYRHAPAAKCDYKDNEGGYAATRAGDGKRKYFTTGLMSELNNDYNVSYTVTQPEERIYFYIDENVPTQAQYNAHSDVPERRATIRITYTAADGTKNYQDATFVQAGMRIVRFNKFSNGGFSLRRQEYWFYIEEYEEYLAHYDGKNEYTDTYEGLGWGLDGLESGLGVQDGYDFWQFMSWGWYNTNQIMEKYREQRLWATAEETREEEMTLNTKPSGAAEYCYNKNKRNEDGSVDDVEWYLPTISELEFAIDEYYGTYEVFQNKWYWSSNPGAEGKWNSNEYTNTGNYGENEKEARATKSLYNGSGYEHAVSAANEKYPTYRKWERDWWGGGQWSEEEYEGGSALRTYKFRIRAAYIPEWGKPTDVNPYRRW